MILGSFVQALGQLGDPRFRRVTWYGIGLTLALLFGAYALFLLAIQTLSPDAIELPVVGPISGLHSLLGWASLLFMLVLSVFLMVPVAGAFSGLFLDDIAAAVEARHYSHLPPVPRADWGGILVETLNLLGMVVALNLLMLGFLAFTGPFYVLIFWALNGVLLGREYFTMAAMRRLPAAEARAMRKRNRLTIWMAGVLMAMPLSVPLLGLLVPVLGAATFTHLFHRLRAAGR
ncbi:MAG: EI24 domain-containing protein [Paracoccaceae bacterium]